MADDKDQLLKSSPIANSIPTKRKLNMLSMSEKLELIRAVEGCPGKTNNQFAREFRIPPATMSRILKEKHKIMQVAMQGYSMRKRLRPAKYPELEKELMAWMYNGQEIGAPVTGKYLKLKAMELASVLKINNFVASNGWLEGFKKRCRNLKNLNATRDCEPLCEDEPASRFVEQILEEGSETLCKEEINASGGFSDRASPVDESPSIVKQEPADCITRHEAQQALDTVRTYFQSLEDAPDTIFEMLETIKNCVDHVQ